MQTSFQGEKRIQIDFHHGLEGAYPISIPFQPVSFKMADEKAPWKDDEDLNKTLSAYVRQNLKRTEILDFMKSEFLRYDWSMRSLDRRLRHFGIFYHNKTITIDTVKAAVEEELNGPGQLLGYRGMFQKITQEHI